MEWKVFTAEFEYEKKKYEIHFYAKDFEDAENRLLALRLTGKVTGEIIETFPYLEDLKN